MNVESASVLRFPAKAVRPPVQKLAAINPRTPRDRARALAEMLRIQAGLERALLIRAFQVLDATARRAAAAFVEAGAQAAENAVLAETPTLVQMLDAHYRATYDVVGRPAMEAVADQPELRSEGRALETKDQESEFLRLMLAFIQANALSRATLMADTTVELLREVLVESLSAGETLVQTGRRIRESLGGASARTRAAVIARTETHSAAQSALHDGVDAAGFEPLREWGTIRDGRQRSEHDAVDGQRRGFREPFDVGGEKLRFPGDPNGSAENTIRCRCQTLFLPRDAGRTIE